MRLAGLYALDRSAQDNPPQRQTIVNVVSAYLRMPWKPPPEAVPDDPAGRGEHRNRVQEREVRVTAQNIIIDHLDPDARPMHFWQDVDLDLHGATLIEFTLRGCVVRRANFSKTRFIEQTFRHRERQLPRSAL